MFSAGMDAVSGDLSFDVVIVGAGCIGSAASRHLGKGCTEYILCRHSKTYCFKELGLLFVPLCIEAEIDSSCTLLLSGCSKYQ